MLRDIKVAVDESATDYLDTEKKNTGALPVSGRGPGSGLSHASCLPTDRHLGADRVRRAAGGGAARGRRPAGARRLRPGRPDASGGGHPGAPPGRAATTPPPSCRPTARQQQARSRASARRACAGGHAPGRPARRRGRRPAARAGRTAAAGLGDRPVRVEHPAPYPRRAAASGRIGGGDDPLRHLCGGQLRPVLPQQRRRGGHERRGVARALVATVAAARGGDQHLAPGRDQVDVRADLREVARPPSAPIAPTPITPS